MTTAGTYKLKVNRGTTPSPTSTTTTPPPRLTLQSHGTFSKTWRERLAREAEVSIRALNMLPVTVFRIPIFSQSDRKNKPVLGSIPSLNIQKNSNNVLLSICLMFGALTVPPASCVESVQRVFLIGVKRENEELRRALAESITRELDVRAEMDAIVRELEVKGARARIGCERAQCAADAAILQREMLEDKLHRLQFRYTKMRKARGAMV
ncbi:hypothetical protein B0H21DRAFT_714460 [Amylocystis lapponica]|nr:hypothetical protein B0H21DRAFT_714460 [Amylocystis lapponica]